MTVLLTKLHVLESQHKLAPSETIDLEFNSQRGQINDLLCYKAKVALQTCHKISYEYGDKCKKTLARLIREHKLRTYITHIISSRAQKTTLPMQISQVFRDFYASLYNLPTTLGSQTQIDKYIQSSQIPRLSLELREELDAPMKLEA